MLDNNTNKVVWVGVAVGVVAVVAVAALALFPSVLRAGHGTVQLKTWKMAGKSGNLSSFADLSQATWRYNNGAVGTVTSNNTLILTIPAHANWAGVWSGDAHYGLINNVIHDGDKYHASVEAKALDSGLTWCEMGVEYGKEVSIPDVPVSMEWHKQEVTGTRSSLNKPVTNMSDGTYVVYFNNHTDHQIQVQLKNFYLERL